jgi:hypothetical protein
MKIDLKNVTTAIKDGGANTVEINHGDGTFRWTERVNREYHRDRGLLDTVRNGDEEPVDITIDLNYEFITGDAGVTVEDALKKIGGAAAWVSSSADPCEPYAVDIEVTHDLPCTGVPDEKLLFADFRYESIDHDVRAGTITITGKANVTRPVATRGNFSA